MFDFLKRLFRRTPATPSLKRLTHKPIFAGEQLDQLDQQHHLVLRAAGAFEVTHEEIVAWRAEPQAIAAGYESVHRAADPEHAARTYEAYLPGCEAQVVGPRNVRIVRPDRVVTRGALISYDRAAKLLLREKMLQSWREGRTEEVIDALINLTVEHGERRNPIS